MMGGYAAFVWSAYGAATALLLGLLLASVRTLRRRQAELEASDGEPRARRRSPKDRAQ